MAPEYMKCKKCGHIFLTYALAEDACICPKCGSTEIEYCTDIPEVK